MSSAEAAQLCEQYQKKTDREHVLDNPEPYTGAMETTSRIAFVKTGPEGLFAEKELSIIPGVFKLFDEAAVNARDHYVRQNDKINTGTGNHRPVTKVEFEVGDDGRITVRNDGDGIDVTRHPEHGMYIPEMVFGHLRTSSNYSKLKKRTGGGRNGLGFKLALIWSKEGYVETVDAIRGLKYFQRFDDNLTQIGSPKITKSKCAPYTKVSFLPDFRRLGIAGLGRDMLALIERRVHDIAAVTPSSVKVSLNGQQVACKNFTQYVEMFECGSSQREKAYERHCDAWEYAVCLSDQGQFGQVSLVNGIHTTAGGKHVDFIIGQVVKAIQQVALRTSKTQLKPSSIKEQLFLFLRCDIPNPIFDSQTKDCLMTPSTKFDTKCTVSPKFIKQLVKMGVVNIACSITEAKDKRQLSKQNGAKTASVSGIPKLVDAHWAGTRSSSKAILLIVEGDSAKAGVVSGLSREDRNAYGIYPLKGKLMNVRGETAKRIAANKEICDIKRVLGLEIDKTYETHEDLARLRYGRVLFLTDQDKDGTHIKALGINLLHSEWRTLLLAPNFVGFMSTPILRVSKGSTEHVFYTEQECEAWKASCQDSGQYRTKYYKGLGTSSAKEFKEYFKNQRVVMFTHSGDASDRAINKVFDKNLPDARKVWLRDYDPGRILDADAKTVDYETFMDNDMIHFSKYDCDRSIPNVMDGLKTSQRKTLFGFLRRNNRNEIKVAQMSGYISEHACYHHGEASLNGTIIAMAQNHVGSNNINLLSPNGQFGTRLQGGKDAASERYIFTQLEKITRLIYRKEDESSLRFLTDDGTSVEPAWYCPVLPMLLINGSRGIGTGFSTFIPPCDPLRVIEYLRSTLVGTAVPTLDPFYRGSTCDLEKTSERKYVSRSKFDRIPGKVDAIRVTDLCIGHWTDDFKAHLDKLMSVDKSAKVVKAYKDVSTDREVDVTVTFVRGTMALDELGWRDRVAKRLKLNSAISLTNMHAFDSKQKLRSFESLESIADAFMETRFELYGKRKEQQICDLDRQIRQCSTVVKFITLVLQNTIDIRSSESSLRVCLRDIHEFPEDIHDRLLNMPLRSLTVERVQDMITKCKDLTDRLKQLKARSLESIWLGELDEIRQEYTLNLKTRT